MEKLFTLTCRMLLLTVLATVGTWGLQAQVATNYAFSQFVGTYTPIQGVELGKQTGFSGNTSLDDIAYNLPVGTIPFPFVFDGNPYTELYVNTNGHITLGSVSPGTTNYSSLSSTGTYAGAIAAFSRDLQGGYNFTASRVTGSDTLTNVTVTQELFVGQAINGTGIPTGATIVEVGSNFLRISAPATSNGANAIVTAATGVINYDTVGVAPNREFVVQYSGFKVFGTSTTGTPAMTLNFQIRLQETTNRIQIVYGRCTPGLITTDAAPQVGLRGPNNTFATNVNNRLVNTTNDWLTSIRGTTNASAMRFVSSAPANVIDSGLTFQWTPLSIVPGLVTVTPAGDQCIPVARTITVDVESTPGATGVVLSSSTNGVANADVNMTLIAGTADSGTWQGILPAATGPGLLTTTFSFLVTDGNGSVGGPYAGGSYTEQFTATDAGADQIVPPGQITVLSATASDPALFPVVISEVTHFETGTGATNPYPAYMGVGSYDFDGLEITNIGQNPVNIGGLRVISYTGTAPTTYTYVVPAGTVIPVGGVATFAQNTAAVSSPADLFFAMATGFSPSSSTAAGYVLKTAGGDIIDAVSLNNYAFPVSTGVTGADWSGNIGSTSGLAGVVRTAANDSNLSTDWSLSSVSVPQTYGTYNTGLAQVATTAGAFTWTPGGDTTQSITVGPFTPGIYVYTVSYTYNGCTNSDEVSITVPACSAPAGLSVGTVLDSSAIVTWTSFGVSSNIEYGPAGFTPGTGTTIYAVSSPYTITGLSPLTSYSVYVIDSCIGTLSDPLGPVNFATQCSPFPFPGNTAAVPIVATSYPFNTTVITANNPCFTDESTAPATRAGVDVFFQFTADSCASAVTISLCGSDFDTYLYIRDAANTTTIESSDDDCGLQSEIILTGATLTPGATYLAVLEPFSATGTGTFVVNISQTFGAVNPVVAVSSTNASCPNIADGSASVVVTANAKSPLSYVWTTGDTTASITGLTPGTYEVSVTNGCGGVSTDEVTVFGDFEVFSDILNATCAGDTNGSIDISLIGETSPVFVWSTGDTTEDLTNLAAGFYSLTVIDGACFYSDTLEVTEPDAIVITVDSVIAVPCFGDATGGVDLSVTGGTFNPPLNAQLSTGFPGGNSCGGGNMFDLQVNSDIQVTGIDLNLNTSGTINIYVKPGSYLGFETNAAAWILAYSANVTTLGTGTPTPMVISPALTLPAGSYGIFVNADLTYTNQPLGTTYSTPALTLTVGHGLCSAFGGTNPGRAWNGNINYTIPGDPYIYEWSHGDSTEDVSGLAAGTYTLTVTDANGCTATETVTITEPATAVSATVDTVINLLCNGAGTGAIEITPAGGTSPYTFNWTGGSTDEDPTGLAAGNYSGSITDNNGCLLVAGPVTITEPTAIQVNVDSVTNVLCSYDTYGEIFTTVTGGTAPYTILWGTGDSTEHISDLAPGSYMVDVTDANNCLLAAGPVIVSSPPALTLTVDSVTDVLCSGGNNGAIFTTSGGGVAPYDIVWDNGDSTQNLSDLEAGGYLPTVTDANGCVLAAPSVNVAEPAALNPQLDSLVGVSCAGAGDGGIYITMTGGVAPYTFVWSSADSTEDLTNLSGGVFTGTITDANGCELVSPAITVTEADTLTYTVDATTNVSCFGGSNGAISITVSGGTTPITYAWSNGSTTEDLTGLTEGPYRPTITDDNGCEIIGQQITITEPATAVAATSTTTSQIQGGAAGSISVTVSGGVSPYVYLWSNGATTEDLSNLNAGIYTLTITDDNGCQLVLSDTVDLIIGISDVTADFSVNIYPNPTQNHVFLDLNMTHMNDVVVEVFNMNGQVIRRYKADNVVATKFEMNFSTEAAGVYYAKIVVGGTTLTKRIVVAR